MGCRAVEGRTLHRVVAKHLRRLVDAGVAEAVREHDVVVVPHEVRAGVQENRALPKPAVQAHEKTS